FSGGKNLRGPQNSGLVVGTEEMIRKIRFNRPPNQRFGRSLTVGKETMIALHKAVERYAALDHDALWQAWSDVVDTWMMAWGDSGIVSRSNTNESAEPSPRVIMRCPAREARDEAVTGLLASDPPIAVVLNDRTSIAFSPHQL